MFTVRRYFWRCNKEKGFIFAVWIRSFYCNCFVSGFKRLSIWMELRICWNRDINAINNYYLHNFNWHNNFDSFWYLYHDKTQIKIEKLITRLKRIKRSIKIKNWSFSKLICWIRWYYQFNIQPSKHRFYSRNSIINWIFEN